MSNDVYSKHLFFENQIFLYINELRYIGIIISVVVIDINLIFKYKVCQENHKHIL